MVSPSVTRAAAFTGQTLFNVPTAYSSATGFYGITDDYGNLIYTTGYGPITSVLQTSSSLTILPTQSTSNNQYSDAYSTNGTQIAGSIYETSSNLTAAGPDVVWPDTSSYPLTLMGTVTGGVTITPTLDTAPGLALGSTQIVATGSGSNYAQYNLIWASATAAPSIMATNANYVDANVTVTDGTYQAGTALQHSGSNYLFAGIYWYNNGASTVGLPAVTASGKSDSNSTVTGVWGSIVVGSETLGNPTVPVVWTVSGTTATAKQLTFGSYTDAYALATNGTIVVGYGDNGVGNGEYALEWTTAGVMTDLSLIGAATNYEYTEATSVDANGDVFGWGETAGGTYSAVEWVPTPEPSTLSLLAIGGICLLRRRRRAMT